jgi:hypothetical protein
MISPSIMINGHSMKPESVRISDYQKKYYASHRDRIKERTRTHRLKYREHYLENARRYKIECRLRAIKEYGGRCACCGYDNLGRRIKFANRPSQTVLEIDHINGFGNHERRVNRTEGHLYIDLIKKGFPPGYRILCGACNRMMESGDLVCLLHQWEEPLFSSIIRFVGMN